MIECDECGTFFRPVTDANKCPTCGAENHQDVDGAFVFSHCNVCGIRITATTEGEMGMCDQCADERGNEP